MDRTSKKFIMLTAMALALLLALTGCRQSPVLEQIIYTNTATVIDINHQKEEEEEDPDEEEDLHDEDVDDAESNDDEIDYNRGQEGEQPEDGFVPDLHFAPDADLSGLAEGRTEIINDKDDDDEEFSEVAPENSDEPESDAEPGAGDEANPEDPSREDEFNDGDNENEEPGFEEENPDEEINYEEADKHTMTDAEGNQQEIPDNVKYFTAVGYAAQMVEMLGGYGWLYAADEDFIGSYVVNEVCADVADGTVQQFWYGDGSSPMSDYNFEEVLSLGPGTVCLEISGMNTYSPAQVARLNEAGLSYYVLPELNTGEDLISAARQMAEIMNIDTARTKANRYIDWVNSVSVSRPSMNYYSVYLTDYHDNISYTLTAETDYSLLPFDAWLDGNTGSGVATAYSWRASELISEYMEKAGVTNESAAYTSNEITTDEVYVAPMFNMLFPSFSSSNYSYCRSSSFWDYFVTHVSGGTSVDYLGNSEQFQTVIVSSADVKYALRSNWFWQYHEEHYFDTGSSVPGAYIVGDTVFNGSIMGDYMIYVNPEGLGSWAKGSVDSPLEAYWVASVITGTVSDSTLRSQVKNFYSTFFDTNIDDDTLDWILNTYDNEDPWF